MCVCVCECMQKHQRNSTVCVPSGATCAPLDATLVAPNTCNTTTTTTTTDFGANIILCESARAHSLGPSNARLGFVCLCVPYWRICTIADDGRVRCQPEQAQTLRVLYTTCGRSGRSSTPASQNALVPGWCTSVPEICFCLFFFVLSRSSLSFWLGNARPGQVCIHQQVKIHVLCVCTYLFYFCMCARSPFIRFFSAAVSARRSRTRTRADVIMICTRLSARCEYVCVWLRRVPRACCLPSRVRAQPGMFIVNRINLLHAAALAHLRQADCLACWHMLTHKTY